MKTYGHQVLKEIPNLQQELQAPTKSTGTEQVSKVLLWEYDLKCFNWDYMRAIVVQRVCERGHLTDFYAILQLYGYETIKCIIKNEIKCFSSPYDLEFACYLFNIEITETKSYHHAEKRNKIFDKLQKGSDIDT
jgi:hypothetical protein